MNYSMMWNGVGWFGGISMMFSWVIILAGIVLFVVTKEQYESMRLDLER